MDLNTEEKGKTTGKMKREKVQINGEMWNGWEYVMMMMMSSV